MLVFGLLIQTPCTTTLTLCTPSKLLDTGWVNWRLLSMVTSPGKPSKLAWLILWQQHHRMGYTHLPAASRYLNRYFISLCRVNFFFKFLFYLWKSVLLIIGGIYTPLDTFSGKRLVSFLVILKDTFCFWQQNKWASNIKLATSSLSRAAIAHYLIIWWANPKAAIVCLLCLPNKSNSKRYLPFTQHQYYNRRLLIVVTWWWSICR